MIQKINPEDFFQEAGVDLNELRPDSVEKAPQFFEFHTSKGDIITVESTARNVMATVLSLPVDVQRMLFVHIAKHVSEVGEQAVLLGKNKQRGARVVRLASDAEYVCNLLLTY